MTIYKRRNVVLRNALTKEAIIAFQSCMESPTAQNDRTKANGSSQKEIIVRTVLSSDWVQKFEMSLSRKNDSISLIHGRASSILKDEKLFTKGLYEDSSEIEKSFQKSLNASFEGALLLCYFISTSVV